MNCEESKTLLPEYWEGALDEADSLILGAHLERCPQCRAEAEQLKQVWTGLAALPPELPGDQMRARFYDRLDAYRQGAAEKPKRSWWPGWRLPAPVLAFAMLAVGFFSGYVIDHRKDTGQLAQLRNEVGNMRQLVTLSLLQQQNATDRLQGVSWAYRVQRSDTEVLAALLSTINHDPNVNVRIAAVDAMKTFAESPVARRGLVQALGKQDSAMVEIALIDQLVDLKDASAKPALDALSKSAATSPDVRERAQWALGQMQ